jgi:AcrR family transcriptional regulator
MEAPAKAPTRRAVAKQQTRNKVIAAARTLFSEHGYEGATIRDIAAAAGMSTGAVFANFSDKGDLFRAIMLADLETLSGEMAEAASRAKGVEEALLKIFSTGYAFYKSQLPLARAFFSVSWAPKEGEAIRECAPRLVHELIFEQLNAAVARGELSQEAEVKLRVQMLHDAYMANFRYAIFQGWSLEALQARSRDQIRILLAGARRG